MCRDNLRTCLDDFREKPWFECRYGGSIFKSRGYGILKLPALPVFALYDSFYLNPIPLAGPVVIPFSLMYNLGWTLGDIVCPELWAKMYPY